MSEPLGHNRLSPEQPRRWISKFSGSADDLTIKLTRTTSGHISASGIDAQGHESVEHLHAEAAAALAGQLGCKPEELASTLAQLKDQNPLVLIRQANSQTPRQAPLRPAPRRADQPQAVLPKVPLETPAAAATPATSDGLEQLNRLMGLSLPVAPYMDLVQIIQLAGTSPEIDRGIQAGFNEMFVAFNVKDRNDPRELPPDVRAALKVIHAKKAVQDIEEQILSPDAARQKRQIDELQKAKTHLKSALNDLGSLTAKQVRTKLEAGADDSHVTIGRTYGGALRIQHYVYSNHSDIERYQTFDLKKDAALKLASFLGCTSDELVERLSQDAINAVENLEKSGVKFEKHIQTYDNWD